MKQKLSTTFSRRQYMSNTNYEIFYYHDNNLQYVSSHTHSHYEFYFFLEGDIEYEVSDKIYHLRPGDYMLIPPDTKHRPIISGEEVSYRRIVLWLSQEYYDSLCQQSKDFSYGYDYVLEHQSYHFRSDFIVLQDIQSKLIELIEEIRSNHPFHDLHCHLKTSAFLAHINRSIYDMVTSISAPSEAPLYLRICDYINMHLTEDLSLDVLAKNFYLSKYHIAHSFKENMGISLHQYITKKRLLAIKSGIPSGMPFVQLAHDYGFRDYTGFYRAFKKEFGISPKEYKEQHYCIEDFSS